MGRSVVDLIFPEDNRPDASRIMGRVQGGKSWQGQFEIARRDGDRLPVLATVTPVFDEHGQTIGMVGVTTDISDLQKREREMEVVVRISKALRSAKTRDEMAPVIVEQVHHLLQTDGAALATFHSSLDEVVIELANGVLSSWTGMCISAKIPLGEEIFSRRQPYWNNDIHSDNRLAYPALWEGVKSAAIAPLIVSGERVGVLIVSRPQGIDPEVIRLLSAIADIAANALNRSSLHEQTRLHAEQMATVETIGRMLTETLDLPEIYARLAQSVFELLPDIASIFISRFEREKELIRCDYAVSDGEVLDTSDFPPVQLEPPGYGPQSEAIRTCQAVTVNDLQSRLQQTITVFSIGSLLPQSALYVPMLSKGEVIGVMQVQSYTLNRFGETDRSLLTYVANAAAISIVNAGLYAELQESYMQTILSLGQAVDARDTYTADHSQRLSDWAVRVAVRMGCSQADVQDIRWAGQLHDIGKIGVPDAILSKPGPLSHEEWEIMRRHPQVGEEILRPLKKFQGIAPMVGAHHERYDGMGYPRGLKGEQIPLGARILTVVDSYVAMTDDRLYRKAFGHREAIEEMIHCSGTQFDPIVLDEFMSLLKEHEVHPEVLDSRTVHTTGRPTY
jgi:HD-GYP domain-containing protein (c-di-GMP phosphodiesterase class II)